MISKIRTCLVAILAVTTVITSIPVYATDTRVDTNIETVENQLSDSEQIEENQVQNAIEQHLNYLYIESPYIETPATQRIVVSWGDGTENIEEIDLSVEHNGDTQTWTSVKSEDGVFLYEKAYADGEDGIYTITKLTVKTAEMETSYLLSDLGMEAKFGVNEAYEGMSELQPLEGQPDAEAATDEEQYDVAVMSIDEDGNVMEESSIEDALEKAEVEEYNSDEDIQTYAGDNARAVNENVVVALDPGHDSTHTGAGANGVREEVLTLKIAQYCKEELEKYANVSVYMTRTTAACPYPGNKNSGGDISDRVYAAAKAGASIFVSFHLNSSTSTSAKGAEVIVPNNSWKPEVAQQGKELANDIMDELTAIGLQKRSIYSKDTTLANEKYPDGSKSDYFSVQIAAKENNIPGIIVEHAFVTNTGDVNTYLNNEAGLKKLGVADATGIAKYLGLSKTTGTWVQDSNGWKYKENGKYVSNSWKDIARSRYYFDSNGYRVTGWQTISNKKYYFMSDGTMRRGWLSFGTTYYYMGQDGVMKTGWQTISDKKYYFMTDGTMRRDWLSFGTTYYYMGTDGVMKTGWQTISNKKYYFMTDGTMRRGWLSFGTTYYYMGTDGVMKTGWQTISDKKYYFMTDGTMWRGWLSFGSIKYYFMTDGTMRTGWLSFGSTYYYMGQNGIMQTGWQTISNKKYYFMTDGTMWRGWLSFGSVKYYFDSKGVMVTGNYKIDGKTYIFAPDGKLTEDKQYGWKEENEKTYYYNKEGQKVTGWQTIEDKKYYFMSDGTMRTGWLSFGSTYYYMGQDGVMKTSWQTIENKKYYFMTDGTMRRGWLSFGSTYYYMGQDGVMKTGWQTVENKKYYFMTDGTMRRGWLSFGSTYYYMGQDGVMKTGWQTIENKKYYFMTDGTMRRGWLSFGSTYYYMGQDGVIKTGWQTISNKRYYFLQDGTMLRSWQIIANKKYYFMQDGAMWTGWLSFGKTRYYLDKNGVMQTGWQFISNTWYYFRTNGTLDDSCTTDQLMAVSGKTTVTASQMEKYFKDKGATYPAYYSKTDAPTLEKFCQIYVEEANAEGINGAIAFTQAMKETAWLKFGGDVKIEQNNFAGLGTTGGGVAGASFATVREGIRAQIQHLKAYGSKNALKNECVDPRFSLVARGSALYVEWLGQKENPNRYGWATSKGYGIDIVKMVKNLQTY